MSINNEIPAQEHGEGDTREHGKVDIANDNHEPRKPTFAENAILTIKVLAGAGLVIAALWRISLWTSSR
jgi:hypothetical protein